jgi:hypothetical protein
MNCHGSGVQNCKVCAAGGKSKKPKCAIYIKHRDVITKITTAIEMLEGEHDRALVATLLKHCL